MKFLISVILIALLAFAMGLYFPWWTIAIAAFIVSILIRQSPGLSFLSGFIAVFCLWLILAWGINSANNSILASKITHILPLGGSIFLLVLLTGFVGGIIGGFAGLAGAYLPLVRDR